MSSAKPGSEHSSKEKHEKKAKKSSDSAPAPPRQEHKSTLVSLRIGNTSEKLSQPTAEGYTHKWILFVRPSQHSPFPRFTNRDMVRKVIFKLHETFKNPMRVLREPPFEVHESGYGAFTIQVSIYFRGIERPITIPYELALSMVDKYKEFSIEHRMELKDASSELRRTVKQYCPSTSSSQVAVARPSSSGSDSSKTGKHRRHQHSDPTATTIKKSSSGEGSSSSKEKPRKVAAGGGGPVVSSKQHSPKPSSSTTTSTSNNHNQKPMPSHRTSPDLSAPAKKSAEPGSGKRPESASGKREEGKAREAKSSTEDEVKKEKKKREEGKEEKKAVHEGEPRRKEKQRDEKQKEEKAVHEGEPRKKEKDKEKERKRKKSHGKSHEATVNGSSSNQPEQSPAKKPKLAVEDTPNKPDKPDKLSREEPEGKLEKEVNGSPVETGTEGRTSKDRARRLALKERLQLLKDPGLLYQVVEVLIDLEPDCIKMEEGGEENMEFDTFAIHRDSVRRLEALLATENGTSSSPDGGRSEGERRSEQGSRAENPISFLVNGEDLYEL